MKLHLPTGLRAALIAALTAVGFTLSQAQAFENATWTFENSMEAQTNITGLSYTWKGGGEAAYVDSGMVAGTKVGDYTLTGALGKAITFGSGQYIQVGNVAYWTSGDGSLNVDNNAKNSYTVIAWVKFDAIAGEQEFFGTSDQAGKGIGFGAKAGTVDALTKYVAHNTIGTQSVTANQWVNIAFSYNKDTDTMTAYVNGDSVGSVSFNGFNSPGGDASIIGGSATNADRTAFAGQIAELSILSGAYDQEQILAAAHLSAGEVTTYTWAGTEQNHNLTSDVWSDGESFTLPYSATDPLIFGTSGCKTVTISGDVTSKSIKVQAGAYTFENSGTLTMQEFAVESGASLGLTGTGIYSVNKAALNGSLQVGTGATLRVTVADAAKSILAAAGVGNNGTVEIGADVTIGESLTSKLDGTLKVADGKRLTLGTTKDNHTINLSSLDALVLGAGANIDTKALKVDINNLTANNSTLKMLDTKDKNTDGVVLHGTTTLAGNLTIASDWKYKINIEELAGTGNLQLTGGNEEHRAVIGDVNIGSLDITNKMTNVELNGSVTLSGALTVNGATNATDSGTLSVGGLNGSAALNVTGGLTFTGADTYSYTGALIVGGQIVKNGTGSQTISGTALNDTVKVQAGTLVLNGSYAIDNITGDMDIKYTGGDNTGNGFKTSSGTIVVYFVADGAMLTKDSAQFTYGGETAVVDEEGKFQVSEQTNYTTFYVNKDEEAVSTAKKRSEMQNIVLAQNTTLNVDEDFNGEHIDIVSGTATVNIASGKTLTAIADGATITGAGTYVLEQSAVVGNQITMSDTLGEGWTGTVQIHDVTTSATTQNDFTPLSKDGSTIELKGFNGLTNKWLSDQSENIKLTNSDDRGYAWYYSAATRNSGTSTFSGDWSGDGTLQTAGNKLQYKFIGDISAWEGKFQVVSGTPTLTFAGESNVVKAAIDRNNNTLNVVVDTTADATFYNTVDVSSLSVAAGKKATFQANSTVGQLNGAGTVGVTGTDTILTITGAAGANATGAITVATGATLDLAVGNALGSTQTVTNSGNVLIHKTLTQGKIDGGTLTLASDFPVTGGGIVDVDGHTDTGNGFSQGGTMHIVENRDQLVAITGILHGSKEYELTEVDQNGNITSAANWSIYQLNTDSQYAVKAIMDYANTQGSGADVLKTIVVNGMGEDGYGLSLVDDSSKLRTSMLEGEHLESFTLNLAGETVLNVDSDCVAAIGTAAGSNATISLEKDATVGSITAADQENWAAVGLTISGKEKTITTGNVNVEFGSVLTIDEDTTVKIQPENEFVDLGSFGEATVKLKKGAVLEVLGKVKFSTLADDTEATIAMDSDEPMWMYSPTYSNYSIKGARIVLQSAAGYELNNIIDATSEVVNAGPGAMTDISTNAAYAELAAQGGDIVLQGKTADMQIGSLKVADGHTVSMTDSAAAIVVSKLASFGSGATVSSALTMAANSTLDGTASLDNHALTLNSSIGISSGLWTSLQGLEPERTMELFTNVSSLTLNGSQYQKEMDLADIFSHEDLKAKKYSLSYKNNNVIITRAADNGRYWKGGAGTWNTADKDWKDDPGAAEYVTFENGCDAYFTTGTGKVTLGTNIEANSITVSGEGVNYTFDDATYTLTVADSVNVTDKGIAAFAFGLNGENLQLNVDESCILIVAGVSSVKGVAIGASGRLGMSDKTTPSLTVTDSFVNAGSVSVSDGTLNLWKGTAQGGDVSVGTGTLQLASGESYTFGNVTATTLNGTGADLTIGTNGSLAASGTVKDLSLGNKASVEGDVTASNVALQGAQAELGGSLTTGSLSGNSELLLDSGTLIINQTADLNGVDLHTIGTSSITASGTGVTVTLNGTIFNEDSVTLSGSFDVSNCSSTETSATYVGGADPENGFKRANIEVTVVDGGTSIGTVTLTYKGASTTTMTSGKATFAGSTDYSTFYVNKSGSTEKVSTALGGFDPAPGAYVLASGTTLQVDENHTVAMSSIGLATGAAANLLIDSGSTVTTDGATTKALTLKGAGTLAVASGETTTGVTLNATEWTGTVSFTNAELATLDGAYTNNSTVSLTGGTGSMGATPITGKVVLNEGTDGWGFGQTATADTQFTILDGALSGSGNLGVKSGTVDSTFNLNGDINSWNGNFIVATDADTTLNLGGSGAKTVNGTVSGTNLKVNVNADTTFSGALNVEKLTVDTSKAATLKADSTVNEVNASNGSLKVDDGKTLTVTANALPKGLKLGVGSTIELVDDAYMRGEGNYAYYGGTVENRTDREQAMGFNNADITVTGTTLGVHGGSGFTVNNKLVNATLDVENGLPSTVILNNVLDSLEVAGNLEIGPSGLLKVANGSSKQTLNISGYTTLTLADSTTLDADLTLNNGATLKLDYNMSSPVATSLESGTLTLASGLTLSGDLYAHIERMEVTGSVNLFTGVGALTLGESAYSEPVKAQLYFSNMADLGDKGDYLLEYNDVTGSVFIRFEATSAHTLTWDGTATEHRWVQDDDTVTDWLEGNPAASAYFQEGDNAKFTADAAEKTVTIVQDITARNITIDSPDCYTFENSDDYSITAQKFEMTGHDGLAKTGEGKLTLDIADAVSLTDSALLVEEGSLEIGTDTASGTLALQASALEIAENAELSVASIEGDGTSSIALDGTMTVSEGTVSNLNATEGSLLKIADLGQTTAGTLSVKTDTTLYGLENGGTLDLGNKTLNLMEKTEQGGNVTAGKLNLAENGNEFKELGTNRVTYAYGSEGSGQLDADAPNLVVDSIAPTMVIPSIALDVTETMGDGGSLAAINRLGDEVTYTLIHANNGLGTVGFTLDDDKLHELIQNGLLSADGGLEKTENDVTLTVGGLDLTWNTSKDETEWGYKVVDETGALTDGANTLNGVQHVVVDSSRTVDVTGVGSEPGLRVRNLTGLDGRTITFSGEEGDTVNLITTEETASNVNLAAENITVKVGLDALDAMDPVDYKDLRVGNVNLTGATLDVHDHEGLDDAFTVNTLSGDGNSMLKGRVIVEGKGGAYRGGYENAYVILHENAEQLLYAGKGLTVAGLGAAKLAYVGPEAHMDAIEGIGMTVTLNDPQQDNSGATLVLDKASWLVDGTIISGMSAINSAATLDTAEAPNLVQAAGLNLDGTTVILNQDAVDDSVMAMAVNDNGKTKGLYLAHLGAEDSNTDRVLLNGYLYNKYYQNARLEGGMLLVDRRDAFFTEDVVRPTTVNGRAGAGMLDDALLEINPQATNPQGDLAAVMTALETNAVANPDRVAAAVAGVSAAALGHAFNNDVQRQLRAIRNRTTTMGLAECTTHEGLPYVNAWVNAEGDYRKLDADGTLAGYTLSSWGGTIGCDVDLTGRLTVGAAFTVLHGEFTSHSADMCEGDLDRDYVSLFARYGYRAWTHTFVATLGFAKSKVDRTVNYGTGSYTTRGDSDGNAFGFLYEVGYTKALNEDASTCLQPIFNVNYRHSSLGGYTEKGGSDAALSVGSADMDAVTFGLGARLQSIVGTSVYNRATLFEGRVLAKLDAGDRDCTTNSSLIGVSAKRSVKSAEVGAFGVEVGAGLTIPVGETGGSIFMDVTGDFRSGYTEFNGTVGYRFSF